VPIKRFVELIEADWRWASRIGELATGFADEEKD
jgi:hypothetical protein